MIELVMHTKKNDMVFHTEKTRMLRLVVEIDVDGMITDVVDKVTCSFDGLQLKQVDLKCVHALNEPHLHDIRLVPNRHEVDQRCSCADPLLTLHPSQIYSTQEEECLRTLCSLEIVPTSWIKAMVIVGNKMHKAFPLPVIKFSLAEEVPTARRRRDATAMKITLLVIEFGDSYEVPASTASTTTTETTSGETGKKSGRTVTLTAEDIQKRKNDVKARTTLLLYLPDEHQLRRLRNLEQTFNRLQVIIGQLQFMDVKVEQEKSEHNVEFHPMVDFVEASPLKYALTFKPTVYVSHIRQFWSTARIETMEEGTKILTTVDGILRTVTESSLRRNLKLQDEEGISSLPDTELFENLTLIGYTFLQIKSLLFKGGEGSGTPIEPHHTPSPEAQQPSHTTHSSPTIPSVSTVSIPPVSSSDTPPIRQYTRRTRIAQSLVLPPVADEPASPLRDVSQGEAFQQIRTWKPLLSPPPCLMIQHQGLLPLLLLRARIEKEWLQKDLEMMPQLRGNLDEGEAAAERVSDDTEEMASVLTSLDAATVLASRAAEVPTGSGSIPTAGPAAAEVPTGSDVVPTASPVFATSTVVTPYRRRKGKEVMIARDAKVVRIHIEEELQSMIDGLDRSNETVAKYLQEYQQFASEFPLERRIDLISDLVRYQDNYTKVHKFQTQQRKPWSKKQKWDYYIAIIRSNLGWKVKDFRGMYFEEIEANFATVWKQLEDFIPMGSKEEAERLKKKGLSLEQESANKFKPLDEVPEEVKSPDGVPKEKVKEMMQLVPIEEVYVEAFQVKHPIIDWKHMDREDLNQLWALVKECLSNRPPTRDKEMKLWVELKRVHQVTFKDKEIFILVEKDYPLRNGLALVMISYKLQVENYSQMANDLILKIYKIANSPRQQVIKFPLEEEVPTASEECSHCQKKKRCHCHEDCNAAVKMAWCGGGVVVVVRWLGEGGAWRGGDGMAVMMWMMVMAYNGDGVDVVGGNGGVVEARIAQSSTLPTVADEPASPVRDDSQGEACPTDSGFIAEGRSNNEGEAAAKRITVEMAWCGGGVVVVVRWLGESGAWHGGDGMASVAWMMMTRYGGDGVDVVGGSGGVAEWW
nr:hypothetical protein [Tanacetum cinerariifolium]